MSDHMNFGASVTNLRRYTLLTRSAAALDIVELVHTAPVIWSSLFATEADRYVEVGTKVPLLELESHSLSSIFGS